MGSRCTQVLHKACKEHGVHRTFSFLPCSLSDRSCSTCRECNFCQTEMRLIFSILASSLSNLSFRDLHPWTQGVLPAGSNQARTGGSSAGEAHPFTPPPISLLTVNASAQSAKIEVRHIVDLVRGVRELQVQPHVSR